MYRRALMALAALALTTSLVGCGPSEEELAAQARAEKWSELQELNARLVEKRDALREVRAEINAGIEELEVAEGESAEEAFAALEAKAAELEEEVASAADNFVPQLVDFINESAAEVGNEPPELKQAIRMKSDEDIELALEYVEKGGDYRRALDILSGSEQYDADYERLQTVKAELEEFRYVTEERFKTIEKGMTVAKVRELLGPVNLRNIRDYEDQGVTAWFYQKDPEVYGDRAAAGVFFRKGKVYDLQWEIAGGAD